MGDSDKLRRAEIRFAEAFSKIKGGLTLKGGGASWEKAYASAYQTLHGLDPKKYPQLRGKYRA